MCRKFRLSHKKRHYSVTSLPVSIPIDNVQVYPVCIPYPLSFPLSLPRNMYMSSPIDNLESLQRRVSKANLIPLGKCITIAIQVIFVWRLQQ